MDTTDALPVRDPSKVPPRKSIARACFDPFKGNNQDGVFESLDEFDVFANLKYGGLNKLQSMEGMVFQEVDFSNYGDKFLELPLRGSAFLGCKFPQGITDEQVRGFGARLVTGNPKNFPFKLFRAFLYSQEELTGIDKTVYEFWLHHSKSFQAQLAMSIHDFSMMDALMDYAEGKSFVAICGGHALKRADPQYQTLVELGNRIATSGFICATGGGPGAMEASNLGAYIAGLQHCRSVEDLSESGHIGQPQGQVEMSTALEEVCMEDTEPRMRRSSSGEGMFVDTTASAVARVSAERLCLREDPPSISPHRENCTRRDIAKAMELIRSFSVTDGSPEYKNSRPAEAVIEEFGLPRHYTPSIGIPTWRYGHEPPNLFTAYHAKFFQNSIREDILLQICFGGLIITPGGPGTMQEIFQAACINAYSKEGYDYPMVFLGVQFWKENGIWDLVCRQAEGRPYAKLLLLSDSVDEVMDHLLQCARQKGLRLIYDISELSNPYWYSRELFEEEELVSSG